jgi:hypothetical protein
MSAKKNQRLAYISQKLGEAVTDAQVVKLVMETYKISEKLARSELREVYQHWRRIDIENMTDHKAKFMELGFDLLNEMREGYSHGPAAAHFKTLATIAGVMTDKVIVQEGEKTSQPAPAPNTVRERIIQLAKDPKVRARALKMGLDLGDLDVVDPEKS